MEKTVIKLDSERLAIPHHWNDKQKAEAILLLTELEALGCVYSGETYTRALYHDSTAAVQITTEEVHRSQEAAQEETARLDKRKLEEAAAS